MTKKKASATNRGLYLFMKKLTDSLRRMKAAGQLDQIDPCFRERMVELHQTWYAVEEEWRQFLQRVRKRQQTEISDQLFSVAVAFFQAAVATYRGPLSYEASLSNSNMQHLIDNSSCEECGSQGDVVAILPHPICPQWKISCPDCGNTWHTKEMPDKDEIPSDND